MKQLDYNFIKGGGNAAAEIALRFTLSVEGVCTAIVGTSNPRRWKSNALLAEKGPLGPELFHAITARWNEVSKGDWKGQN